MSQGFAMAQAGRLGREGRAHLTGRDVRCDLKVLYLFSI
jgi:hypothetical protein